MDNVKRFHSCFICDVNFSSDTIMLEDSSHNIFFIDRKNASQDVLVNFKKWFSNVYMKCIPASMTIIEYSIEESKDSNEAMNIVKKMISPMMEKTEEDKANGK